MWTHYNVLWTPPIPELFRHYHSEQTLLLVLSCSGLLSHSDPKVEEVETNSNLAAGLFFSCPGKKLNRAGKSFASHPTLILQQVRFNVLLGFLFGDSIPNPLLTEWSSICGYGKVEAGLPVRLLPRLAGGDQWQKPSCTMYHVLFSRTDTHSTQAPQASGYTNYLFLAVSSGRTPLSAGWDLTPLVVRSSSISSHA